MSQASRMERSGHSSQAFSRGAHMVATGMYRRPGGNCKFAGSELVFNCHLLAPGPGGKACLSIELPLTIRDPIHPYVSSRLYRACSLSLRRGRPQWYPDSTSAPRRDYNGEQARSPE